jgi:hypothetical protein
MKLVEEFKRLCAEGKSCPPQYIIDQLQGKGPGVLSLSSGGCPLPIFRALSSILPSSDSIFQLDLSDQTWKKFLAFWASELGD